MKLMKCLNYISNFLSSPEKEKYTIKKHKKTWDDLTTYEEPKIIALYKMFPDLQDSKQIVK